MIWYDMGALCRLLEQLGAREVDVVPATKLIATLVVMHNYYCPIPPSAIDLRRAKYYLRTSMEGVPVVAVYAGG
jgi:hypothetical protein